MKTQKTIIFKIKQFPNLSETFIIAQMIAAIKAGFKIQILIVNLNDIKESTHERIIDEYKLLDFIIFEKYKIPKNKLIRLIRWLFILITNINQLNFIKKYYNNYAKFSLTYLFEWLFYQQFGNDSIIHIQFGNNQYPINNLKQTGYFRPSVILTFHGHDAFFPMYGHIPNNGYYDKLFKHGDLIAVNTNYLAEKVIDLGCPKEKIAIVPVGVNTSFFFKNNIDRTPEKILKLITVGRLDKVKGHSYCVEVTKLLVDAGYDVTLTIVGDGAERNNLEELIEKYHLENRVILQGGKSQLEIRQLFWEHDLYLLTAVALPDGRRETQGLATLEAQACGLPAVVFDSGGVRYTVKDGYSGFVCEEYNVQRVVAKIRKFIKDPSLLIKMSEQAINFADENFSHKVIDEKWEIIYRNLSNGK